MKWSELWEELEAGKGEVMSLFGGRMLQREVTASGNILRRVCTQVILRIRKEGRAKAMRDRARMEWKEGGPWWPGILSCRTFRPLP